MSFIHLSCWKISFFIHNLYIYTHMCDYLTLSGHSENCFIYDFHFKSIMFSENCVRQTFSCKYLNVFVLEHDKCLLKLQALTSVYKLYQSKHFETNIFWEGAIKTFQVLTSFSKFFEENCWIFLYSSVNNIYNILYSMC